MNVNGEQVTVQNSMFSSADKYAIGINGDQATVADNIVTGASVGIAVAGANAVIDSNTVQDVPGTGISLFSVGAGQVTNNVLRDDGLGGSAINVDSAYDNGVPTQVAGNTVYCTTPNGGTGIIANCNAVVGPATIGAVSYGPNTVYGYTTGTGIMLYFATATGNIVYGNNTGIRLVGLGRMAFPARPATTGSMTTARTASWPTSAPRF